MANELIGMFGQSPEMTQLGLQQGRDANMAQLAQMSKGSMLAYGAGTAADRLGGAVGGMLGGTDPRMDEANLDKQIQQEVMAEVQQLGIDPTKDWEKFGTIAAQKYNAAGKPDKAFQISQAIEKMKATQAETGYKQAQARKLDREKAVEDPIMNLVKTGKITPQQYAQYMRGELPMDDLKLLETGAATPFYQFVPGQGGQVMVGNARTGELTAGMVGGKPAIKAEFDVPLQTSLAAGKEAGKVTGGAISEAKLNLPQAIATSTQAIQQVEELLKHPGFSTTVGATLLPGSRFVPGTDASDFQTRLEQVKGGAFLEAYKTLKGGGQITEVEGKKATDAIAAMNISQSEKEFRTAATKYIGVIKGGMERAKRGITVAPPDVGAPTVPSNTPVETAPVTLSTKEDVRDAVNSGAISRDQGRAILLDMKSKGAY